jgi:hypothetical protein
MFFSICKMEDVTVRDSISRKTQSYVNTIEKRICTRTILNELHEKKENCTTYISSLIYT